MDYNSLFDIFNEDLENRKYFPNQVEKLSEMERSAITKKKIELVRAPPGGISTTLQNNKKLLNLNNINSISKIEIPEGHTVSKYLKS